MASPPHLDASESRVSLCSSPPPLLLIPTPPFPPPHLDASESRVSLCSSPPPLLLIPSPPFPPPHLDASESRVSLCSSPPPLLLIPSPPFPPPHLDASESRVSLCSSPPPLLLIPSPPFPPPHLDASESRVSLCSSPPPLLLIPSPPFPPPHLDASESRVSLCSSPPPLLLIPSPPFPPPHLDASESRVSLCSSPPPLLLIPSPPFPPPHLDASESRVSLCSSPPPLLLIPSPPFPPPHLDASESRVSLCSSPPPLLLIPSPPFPPPHLDASESRVSLCSSPPPLLLIPSPPFPPPHLDASESRYLEPAKKYQSTNLYLVVSSPRDESSGSLVLAANKRSVLLPRLGDAGISRCVCVCVCVCVEGYRSRDGGVGWTGRINWEGPVTLARRCSQREVGAQVLNTLEGRYSFTRSSEILPRKLTDLEVGHGYRLTSIKALNTSFGRRVLTVLDGKYAVQVQVEDIAKMGLLLVYKGISKISKTAILTFEDFYLEPLGLSIKLIEEAYIQRINTYSITNELSYKDPVQFLVACGGIYAKTVKESVANNFIKVNCSLICELRHPTEGRIEKGYFNSTLCDIFVPAILEEIYENNVIFPLLAQIEAFVSRDSRWIYDGTLEMRINISKNSALSIGARVQIPEIIAKRRALINVQSEEGLCFPVSVLTCLFEPTGKQQRLSLYPNFRDVLKLDAIPLQFEMRYIGHFERLNDISINVYNAKHVGSDTYIDTDDNSKTLVIVPVHVSAKERATHVHLFMIRVHGT
uniref:Uncharacterized protein n=1 Tax=Timema douglasi TaxID=61478 RepID=A0A7R8VRZ8_TIMDO|nr:unnamed protein product [Timema douglasi]